MTLPFVLAAALAVTASIAPAAVATDAPSAKVVYSDLNLRTETGAAAFRRRVDDMVVTLSGGYEVRQRPDVIAARHRGRTQADAVIRASA